MHDESLRYEGTSLDPLTGPAVSDMPWLRSYHDVVEVFRSKAFVQGGGGRRDSAPITGYGVLALAGRDHFERRRIEATLFRKDMLRWFERGVVAPALNAKLAEVAEVAGRTAVTVTRAPTCCRSCVTCSATSPARSGGSTASTPGTRGSGSWPSSTT